MNIGFKESLTVEFKSDRNLLKEEEIIEAVVAFANTEGGDLYIGVENDGEVTGLHKKRKDIAQLAALIANKTVPPMPVITELIENENPFIRIAVSKCTSIVSTSSGKMLRRRIKADGEPENIPMYPYEIATRLTGLRLLDYSAQPVPESSYSDLSAVERERVREIIRTYRGEQALLELTDEEFDKALQFVTNINGDIVPTFTGLLMIGKSERIRELMPTAESAIQVLDGTDVKVNESYFSPLPASFERINGYFNAWNSEEEMELGLYRVAIPKVDKRAFREALVNAFCHRDYSVLGRVRVQIENEGLTITNPGGFVEGITIDNLLYAEPQGRNPVLANALKRIGLAERTGRGIDRIFEGSLLYGKMLPDYSGSTSSLVKLFIPNSIPDKLFVHMISDEQKRLGRPLPLNSLLILNYLKTVHKATVKELTEEINADSSRVKVGVESLVESGLVEAKGVGRGRYYQLSPKVYKKNDNAVGYVRQTDIEKMRYEELVLKLVDEQGYITRANAVELFHLSPPQAYRVLQKLNENGKIKLVGKGKSAKYIKA